MDPTAKDKIERLTMELAINKGIVTTQAKTIETLSEVLSMVDAVAVMPSELKRSVKKALHIDW